MMRTLYSVLFFLLIPFILLRLVWRGLKAPDYLLRWHERFASYPTHFKQGVVWFHAVSVGEAEALFPLVRQFQAQYPNHRILITTTTPTGSARVSATLAETVDHVYLPYDIPYIVDRFLKTFKPVLAVFMETEIWPNIYHACGERQIPLYLINARLSQKSANGYQKLPALIRPTLKNLQQIATQTQEDAKRFQMIGAADSQITVLGNVKFDLEIPETIIAAGRGLKQNLLNGRYVLLAASTHKGEEEQLFEVYKQVKLQNPALLLIIVPRHPERFDEVATLCANNGFNAVKRTTTPQLQADTDIYVVNTMGELKLFYAAADVAFVGGSLVPIGGHNILEAMALGVPVFFGRYMANFKDIAAHALRAEAAIQCQSAEEMVQAVLNIESDEKLRRTLIENAMRFVHKNRGATERILQMLVQAL